MGISNTHSRRPTSDQGCEVENQDKTAQVEKSQDGDTLSFENSKFHVQVA